MQVTCRQYPPPRPLEDRSSLKVPALSLLHVTPVQAQTVDEAPRFQPDQFPTLPRLGKDWAKVTRSSGRAPALMRS